MDADFIFEVEELLFEHKQLCSYYERYEPDTVALTELLRERIGRAQDALYESDLAELEWALFDIGLIFGLLK